MNIKLISLFLGLLVTVTGAQTDDQPAFAMSASAKYLSRFVAYGIDLAGDSPAWGGNISIGHRTGFYADGYYTRPTKSVEDAQQIALDVGYEHDFSSRLSFYAEFAHYIYASDTVNIFSGFSNSVTLNASIDLEFFDLGLSYDRYLGTDGASYFSADISTFTEAGPVYLLPMIQVVFMSQTVEDKYLNKGKGKKQPPAEEIVTTEITGLANTLITLVAVYPIVDHLNFSLVPTLILNHQSELSVESSRFVWNAALRYSFDL